MRLVNFHLALATLRAPVYYLLAAEEPKKGLAVGEYFVPGTIRLENGRLYWWDISTSERRIRPTNETFSQFVDLATATQPEVLKGRTNHQKRR